VNFRRTYEIHRVERRLFFRRPLTWVLLVLLFLTAWGLAAGNVTISSGDSAVGGEKSWMNSEFSLTLFMSIIVFLYYSFFVAIAAGMSVIRDEEHKVGELLHSTPLTPSEYVWGKFSAVLFGFLTLLFLQLCFTAFSFHFLTGAESAEYLGPFSVLNYLRPAVILCAPLLIFLAGVSFCIGAVTRRPIVVFAFPVVLVLAFSFFTEWSPSWLDPRVEKVLGWLDPTSFRWLQDSWLQVDRGVEFYNTNPVGYDVPFLLSRFLPALLGLAAVDFARRRLTRSIRGLSGSRSKVNARALAAATAYKPGLSATAPLGALGMRSKAPGFLTGVVEVARVELRELRSQPGLYLFVPLILVQVLLTSTVAVGAFDSPLLLTPGNLASSTTKTLTLMLTLLLTFYSVESLNRERATNLSAIYYATPLRSTALLFGKTIASSLLGIAVAAAALLATWIVLLVQGDVPFDFVPFGLMWGVILVPTLILWCSFLAVTFAVTRSRYATYALAIAALIATFYFRITGETNWAGNWMMWGAAPWSDMAVFELDRIAIIGNRLLALSFALFLTIVAVRLFPRRSSDPSSTLLRLRPASLVKTALVMSPFWIVPAGLAIALDHGVDAGLGGDHAEKAAKDYWRRNFATWRDAKMPELRDVVVDLTLDPAKSWFRTDGTFTLANGTDEPMHEFSVTAGYHWKDLDWELTGRALVTEDRSGLHVFELDPPLAPDETVTLGFSFEGRHPDGISSNGGGMDQFILPSGVVLNAFSPTFVPVVGYMEGVGVDEENAFDARDYRDDYFEGLTAPLFGTGSAFTTRIRITAPEEYRMNSVGVLVEEEVVEGMRTVVWESDHPVHLFNVVGGKWDVKRGDGVAVFYHPSHAYNVDEMIEALEAARHYYSEWFHPFPWQELKLSEYPALAGYAQGFPTNIPFSESLGFLTKKDPKANAAFHVTAHESAHQWWPNLVIPGDGPGGNVLSEGMAHFSTILLTDAVRGERERIEFCKRIEESYGDQRQVDSERPLVKIDGTRDGDGTVMYDKGGWVVWMLLNHMGRENALEGMRTFIDTWGTSDDHPLLEDFVATLRPFAPDVEAYDAFCAQWFFDVVVPEYALEDGDVEKREDGTWDVTIRVRNKGTGRMPVVVAASSGTRFPEEDPEAAPDPGSTNVVEASSWLDDEDRYQEVRVTANLEPGKAELVILRCTFEPERVVVDPDAVVLQLNREHALFEDF
jgi:ABC-type transport system involved in multi-copper enzyme maturation permease subunit